MPRDPRAEKTRKTKRPEVAGAELNPYLPVVKFSSKDNVLKCKRFAFLVLEQLSFFMIKFTASKTQRLAYSQKQI